MVFWLIASLLLLSFLIGALLGAPYLPTLDKQVMMALDGLGLKRGDSLLDLGCGDGKVAIAAAKRGLRVQGIEVNPLLVMIAKVRCRRYPNIEIHWGNFWQNKLEPTDGIFIFGTGRLMSQFAEKIKKEAKKGTRVASIAWELPGLKKQQEKRGIYFYRIDKA